LEPPLPAITSRSVFVQHGPCCWDRAATSHDFQLCMSAPAKRHPPHRSLRYPHSLEGALVGGRGVRGFPLGLLSPWGAGTVLVHLSEPTTCVCPPGGFSLPCFFPRSLQFRVSSSRWASMNRSSSSVIYLLFTAGTKSVEAPLRPPLSQCMKPV
jgi:hypothetical protein